MATDTTQQTRASLPVIPAAAFVLVWSSGYIAGPYGVDGMKPLSLVAWRFILAAAIALGIAIATVVGHALKVARANPIHALRYE